MVDENGELVEKYYYDEWGVETETLKYGDLNADNNVDITDYTLIKQYVLKGLTNLSTQQIMVSDLNGDGKVDVNDTNILKQIIVKLLKCCPVDTNQDGFINEKNNIKYAGYFYDGETGLYYLNARFYDPETARFIQEDTYRGGINDPLSLNLYTYSHNNPISYYDPTGHSIKKLGDMFKFAATTAKVVAKAVVIPKAKKTAKTLKEDWQSGVDELKKGGVASQGFASYSEAVGGALSSKVNDILHPVETLKKSLINWGTAIIWDHRNIDPVTYMYNQTFTARINRGIELKDVIITKDLNSICSMAGRDSVLIAEMGLPLFGAKAISGGLAKGATKGATANSNAITSINPVKNKFFANQKATISRILRDETGAVGIGKNKNVGGGVKGGNFEKTFVDMMEPSEAVRYERYWKQGAGSIEKVKENGEFVYKVMNGKNINTRQRLYTVPGEKSIKDVKINSKTGETYIRETIFDKYGRRIGNNDYTDHGRSDIPSHTNPHYHLNPYNNPAQHGDGIPGLHPDTP